MMIGLLPLKMCMSKEPVSTMLNPRYFLNDAHVNSYPAETRPFIGVGSIPLITVK